MAVNSVRGFVLILILYFVKVVFCNVHVVKYDSKLKYPFIPLINKFPAKVETSGMGLSWNYIENDEPKSRISEQKCEEYTFETRCEFEVNDFDLNLRKTARVGEFPHMAFLGRKTSEPNKILYTCVGSLISPRFVLTTAKCLIHKQYEFHLNIVSLGDHNVDPGDDSVTKPVQIPIKNVHIYPAYTWPKRYNDIALVELAHDVTFSTKIRPACLWTKDNADGHDTPILATMGSSTDLKLESNAMQKLSLLIIREKECNVSMNRFINKNWKYGVDAAQMCGQEAPGNSFHCKAVLGSPMQIISQDKKSCQFHVAGVTSFKFYPNCYDYPIVLTKVANYVDWIESVVWPGI